MKSENSPLDATVPEREAIPPAVARFSVDTGTSPRSLPAAFTERIWRPGQSGNPTGRGGDFKACQALCRSKSSAAAKRMVELAELDAIDENGELAPLSAKADPRIVMLAAQWVYERAWGPPKPFDPKDEPDPNRPRFDPRLLSPEQLDLVERGLRLMAQATVPVTIPARPRHGAGHACDPAPEG